MRSLTGFSSIGSVLATVVVGVVVAIGISNLFSSDREGMRDGPQEPGTGEVLGPGQGNGQRDTSSVETTTGSLLGFGPLEGDGPLQGNALLAGAGPLQGNAPVFGGGLAGVGNPITGINGPPPTPVTLVSLPTVPVATPPTDPPPAPVTPLPDLGPPPPPSPPTVPAVGDPQVSPTVACVTCFIPPPPPAPTPPPNNIPLCANATCS